MTGGQILVVDDEKSQRDILTVILEGEGYTVESSSNVSQALAFYRNHPVDVVLTDLSMPERDGLALLDDLMKLDPEALVVRKPFRQAELARAITTALSAAHPSA